MLREPLLWLFACAVVGLLIGKAKGLPKQGFFLGLIFGPIGWGILVMLPNVRMQGGGHAGRPGPGPECPRCGRRVKAGDKACPHCGNLLMPVNYRVSGGDPET